jgi:rod shape-determining protein MreC
MAFRNKKRVYAAVTLLLLVAVLAPLSSLTLRGKGLVRDSMAPAQRGTTGILRRVSEAWAAVRGFGGTLEENRELSRELVRVNAELSRWRAAEEENVRLREALGFYEKQPGEIIASDVIGRAISGWWNTTRLGKGILDGIRTGQAVISPDGLVGKTTEVTAHTAEVLLLSDPTCQVSAKIDRVDVFGLVRGAGTTLKGEPQAIIEFINKDKEIRVNDEVVTSGLGAFPRGVHIGYITSIQRDESGLFQQAEITPLPTIGLLDYLFVVPTANREVAQ